MKDKLRDRLMSRNAVQIKRQACKKIGKKNLFFVSLRLFRFIPLIFRWFSLQILAASFRKRKYCIPLFRFESKRNFRFNFIFHENRRFRRRRGLIIGVIGDTKNENMRVRRGRKGPPLSLLR